MADSSKATVDTYFDEIDETLIDLLTSKLLTPFQKNRILGVQGDVKKLRKMWKRKK